MTRRLLVANRGEIAARIFRTCRRLGIETVAVYSDADERAPYVRAADSSERLGPSPAAESYLDVERIMEAVRRAGADTVHPGYGFLSENPALAEACEAAGVTFVGPPAAVMRRMGSKMGARDVAEHAGVPVVPGVRPASQDDEAFRAAARSLGWPVLLKAAAGGGGKGMRPVRSEDELASALAAARQEAQRAFGRDSLYVERLVEQARHIEVQIFGDTHGTVRHLPERDCSLQRRHQKVIEESPAPALAPSLREALFRAALAIGREVGYVGAGTAEFLVDERANAFYFLELNMRLQVEHPVTEAVTGLDLVELQLRVANGEALPFEQDAVACSGHAIEARLYAEDPATLLPQAGRLLRYREPDEAGVRIDSGVEEGSDVTVHYDPLLAKVIAHGATRDDACGRLRRALETFEILGVRHNVELLLALLSHPQIAAGPGHTAFIEEHLASLVDDRDGSRRLAAVAIAGAAALTSPSTSAPPPDTPASVDPWDRVTTFHL